MPPTLPVLLSMIDRASSVPRVWRRSLAVAAMGAALVLDIFVLLPAAGEVRPAAPASGPALSVNFGIRAGATSPFAIGIDDSTYGASLVDDPVEAAAAQELDARTVRIPVGVRGGQVTSSAAGTSGVDVVTLVQTYRSWGYHVLLVIGGRTNDVDVQPGDTTMIVRTFGYGSGIQYSSSNEPTNQGESLADAIASAKMMLTEGRALYPRFSLWGPAWAYYDRTALSTFAHALGSGLAGNDYHHYAMGETHISTAEAMRQTPLLGTEVRASLSDLRGRGLPARVNVDETNLSWRYEDGVAGGDTRFFTAVDTVWLASACGHVMLAGGTCMPYAFQNGALGMTVEADGPNPDRRAQSTPMPGYWGIAAWTGAGRFAHMRNEFYRTTSAVSGVEIFAVNNQAGGYNLVVINKGTKNIDASIGLHHVRAGSYLRYITSPAKPYSAPARSRAHRFTTSLPVSMPGMSVATYVLSAS